MATYTYKALGKNGDLDTGEITAVDRPEALKVLGRRGLQPVKLSLNTASGLSRAEKKSQSSASSNKAGSAASTGRRDDGGLLKLKRAEVVLFTEELSEMLRAGLQLEPALKSRRTEKSLVL